MWGSCQKFRPAWVSHRCRLRPLHTITAVFARCEADPGELIRWQVLATNVTLLHSVRLTG
jgi:hypothetical protein